jgi:hypothetical protein
LHPDRCPGGGKHLQRTGQRRLGKGVGVHPDKKRAVDLLLGPVFNDGLADGQDVVLVETVLQRRSPVAGGAEGHLLGGVGCIRLAGVVGGNEPGDVGEHGSGGRFAGEFVDGHFFLLRNNSSFRFQLSG